jgi:Zn-dependent protease
MEGAGMKQSLRLGTVAGIPIGVNWSVAVIAVIVADVLGGSVLPVTVPHQSQTVYWLLAAAGAVLFAASLLGHELAHALVARRNGMTVRSVTLWMLGGVTELDGDPPSPGAELRIALAGPAASLAAAVLFFGVALAIGRGGGPAVTASALAWLGLMNGALAVFNLLPGAPLDGGRVLRAVLWRRHRDRVRAALGAARAGWYLGLGLIVAGAAEMLLRSLVGGLWLMLIGWFLAGAARSEATGTLATSAFSGLTVSDVMTPNPGTGTGWNTVQYFIDHVAGWSRQSAFPVLGTDGGLCGVVTRRMLARIPGPDRSSRRLDRIAVPVPAEYLAAPADPAAPLLTRRPLAGEVMAVVLAQGRVVGLVTVADIGQAVNRASLPADAAARPGIQPEIEDLAGG